MFKITGGKGFQITFENGYTVSVQLGYHNYCENSNRTNETECGEDGCINAETAIWRGKDGFIKIDGEDVQGYQTPAQVLELLNYASKLPKKDEVMNKGDTQ